LEATNHYSNYKQIGNAGAHHVLQKSKRRKKRKSRAGKWGGKGVGGGPWCPREGNCPKLIREKASNAQGGVRNI